MIACSLSLSQRSARNVALELKPVLEQRQVGDVSLWPDRFHLGNDAGQLAGAEGGLERVGERLDGAHCRCSRNPRRARDAFEVAASGRGGGKSAHGEQALVV